MLSTARGSLLYSLVYLQYKFDTNSYPVFSAGLLYIMHDSDNDILE